MRRITVWPGGLVELGTAGGYIAPLSVNLDPHHDPETASLSYWISHRHRLGHSKSELRSEVLLRPALLCNKDTARGT